MSILHRLPGNLAYRAVKVERVTVLKDRYDEPRDYLRVTMSKYDSDESIAGEVLEFDIICVDGNELLIGGEPSWEEYGVQ